MTADIIIIALGLLFSALLFFRFSELGNPGKEKQAIQVICYHSRQKRRKKSAIDFKRFAEAN